MNTTRDALNDAIMEHLGPAALTGGKMSVLEAFELGWQAATLAAKRQPLTEEMLAKLFEAFGHKPEATGFSAFNWFVAGVTIGESAHGIKA